MLVPNPVGVAAMVAGPVVGAVRSMAGAAIGRRQWRSGGRTHIEVRGIHLPGSGDAARRLEARLLELAGVQTAEVNGVLGRVVVGHDPDVDRGRLMATIADVEREWELVGFAPASAVHPANLAAPVRELVALGTDAVGFAYAVLGSVLPPVTVPPVLPAVATLIDSTPRLRIEVERRLGRPLTDAVFAVGGAVSQALARRPIAVLTDATYRVCLRREVVARREAWLRWENDAAERSGIHRGGPVPASARPAPLPDDPVERVANASAALGAAGYATIFAVSRNHQRATSVLLAAVPRAAKLGRDAFAAQLATDLCRAGTVVFDPDALRRLDRVDAVVVDAAALRTGRRVVGDVVAVDESVSAEVWQQAYDLVDPKRPRARRHRGDWEVVPIERVIDQLPATVAELARERSAGETVVLVLLREGVPAGLVTVADESHPYADAVAESSRRAGSVTVVDEGEDLAERVRRAQADGHVVVAVSSVDGPALAAADVGIGVPDAAGRPPWGAHLLCPGLEQVCVVLDAVGVAHQASTYSAELSVAGSSLGAALGGFGPAATAVARASFPVHFAALLALAVGTWEATEASRRRALVPIDRTPWHAMLPRTVLRRLHSSRRGLGEDESLRRRQEAPAEEAEEAGTLGLGRASADELASPLTPALAAGAGISASLGSIVDAVMIFGVLGLNAVIGGVEQLTASRELRQLIDTSSLLVRLRRSGTTRTERAQDLVPGDVIEFSAGDAVPADCRLLDADGVEVDESTLTGESQLVAKSVEATTAGELAERTSMLYRGSIIAAGRALAVVVATGQRTELGRTARLRSEDAPVTGVAARLAALSRVTLPVTLSAGAGLLLVDLLRGVPIGQALGRAVGLSVAAVPEGLPFVATVAELASARRLAARGVLARSPSTIEALGRVEVLCFDKTGTLTEGRIRLSEISDGQTTRRASELTDDLEDVLAAALRASPWRDAVDVPLPHPTDRAVLDGARQSRIDVQHGLGRLDWVDELRFEPARGYHAVLARTAAGLLISVKGAPEVVLARCTRRRRADVVADLDDHGRAEIEAEIDRLARKGFRVLAVAERPASTRRDLDDARIAALEFRGLVALADPVRSTAAEAVEQLRGAGVQVMMVTGDHPSTAHAIAAELDVYNGNGVMTGAEIEAADDAELAARLPAVTVFARVSPAQKARLVRQLNRMGRVVAMTGDGANDAPAIRLAHVGIAVGTKATPAAREAADLIVTDDRIETITEALVEGRAMWASVRDAVAILLGGNLGEVVFTVGSGMLSTGDTLNARQLLLVNLLTDVLPAMAVAVRPPPHATRDDLLTEGPDASLGTRLTRDIYQRAAITSSAALVAWILSRPVSTQPQASTTSLVALVSAQLGQTMAIRGRTPLVLAADAGSLALLALIVQTPGVSHFFGCRPLLPHQWLISLGAATGATTLDLLARMIVTA